jgi:hypothetical protein
LLRKVELADPVALRATDPLASDDHRRYPSVIDGTVALASPAGDPLSDRQLRLAGVVDLRHTQVYNPKNTVGTTPRVAAPAGRTPSEAGESACWGQKRE